jgi:acetylornithine deacetylase/succinyl-diaminopimelate desuccinylase-like protein
MCNNHKISGMPFGAAHSDHENADAVVAAMESDLINTLAELVAIPSVSGDASMREKVMDMAVWLRNEMSALGIE